MIYTESHNCLFDLSFAYNNLSSHSPVLPAELIQKYAVSIPYALQF